VYICNIDDKAYAKENIVCKVFRLLFCLFQFNRNTETLCFGIEAKQPKQHVLFLIVPKLVSVVSKRN
jgi:hypothetical protein